MSFKSFCEEVFETKLPKPHKHKLEVNLQEYRELLTNSKLKSEKKMLTARLLERRDDIPVFCEETGKFFMCDFASKKKRSREVKSREDKSLCGALLNAMIKEEKYQHLKEAKFNWEVPDYVYSK